jgi:lipopolysaccharide transport system ATP-binding protein
MAVVFRKVSFPPLSDLTICAPDRAVIGIVGEDGSGKRALLRLAVGLEKPVAGEVSARGSRRLLGPIDDLDLAQADTIALDHTLSRHDVLVQSQAATMLEKLRRHGSTIFLVSHDEGLLRSLSDEIWWLDKGKLAARGDPAEILEAYRRHVLRRMRAWGESVSSPLAPSLRRGDGRAELLTVETLGSDGQSTIVWQSGEAIAVRVTLRFHQSVSDPVVGIMIRTRIGFEVYGTNTELEKIKLGPCAAGDTLHVTFSFRCDLCPQEYTLTAASHDPDGVWHDWAEDAVAFSVADSRYTAGVANLRARVSVERR